MKKILSCLMVLCLILALAACGGSKAADMVGTWTGTLDMVDYIVSETPEMEGYLKEAPVAVTLVLGADGNYTLDIDGNTMLPAFREAMVAFLLDQLEQQTGTRMTMEEVEQTTGMTEDEILDEVLAEVDLSELSYHDSGTYKIDGNNIVYDDGGMDPFTLDGNTLTIPVEDFGDVVLTKAP